MKKLTISIVALSLSLNLFSADVKITQVDFPAKINVGNHWVEGVVLNEGTDAITSITISWTVDDGIPRTDKLTGLSISAGSSYMWTHSLGWGVQNEGAYDFKVWISEVNGSEGNMDELQKSIEVFKAERLSLIEIITSANCGPCAATIPGLQERVRATKTYGISVAWHGGPGAYAGDDMYQDNTTMYNRMGYYNGNSYPTTTINGDINIYDYPSEIDESVIENKSLESTLFNIDDLTISIDGDNANFSANIKAPEGPGAYSGAYRVQAILIEKEVRFSSPPGTNGETDFFNVAKEAYPAHLGGTALRDIIDDDGKGILQGSFDLTDINVYDEDQLGVIVFIQNGSSNQVDSKKEIYQTAFADLRGQPDVTVPKEEPTSISTVSKTLSLNIYPNPANDYLTVRHTIDAVNLELSLVSLMGRELVNFHSSSGHTNKLTVNTADLSNGIYLLKLKAGDNIYTDRIVIAR